MIVRKESTIIDQAFSGLKMEYLDANLMIMLNFCLLNSAPHYEQTFWNWRKTRRFSENSSNAVRKRYKKYAKNAYDQ